MKEKKLLLVGAGPMAVEYYKVLKDLNCDVQVVGRRESSCVTFEQSTGYMPSSGGIEEYLSSSELDRDSAIVAVSVEQLASVTSVLIDNGFKNILVEKPAGLNVDEIEALSNHANKLKVNVLVAYNRRFYASVIKAKEIIEADGGVSSFNFEFTEWSHVIEPLKKAPGVKEQWLLANSTHVIDLAFYLGGMPKEISCYAGGKLSWHEKASFAGSGVSKNGALFNYQANWLAPGRWSVEILTKNSRLIFKPMEQLHIQKIKTVAIEKVDIDDEIDLKYKAGLYVQTKTFLEGDYQDFQTVEDQAESCLIYEKIAKGSA